MSYINEIFKILKQKYPDLLDGSDKIAANYYEAIKPTRDRNLELEKKEYVDKGIPLPQLLFSNPLNVTDKCRIDYCYLEFKNIRIQIAVSICSAYYLLPRTCSFKNTMQQTYDDFMYFYNIEYGIRMIASAWDRLSHFLNLAFELRLKKFDISTVLKEIPKKNPGIINNKDYNALKLLNDDKLKEIEDKYSLGLRNIVDHIISLYTLYYFIVLHKYDPVDKDSIKELIQIRKGYLDFLEAHFDLVIKSLNNAIKLVKENLN